MSAFRPHDIILSSLLTNGMKVSRVLLGWVKEDEGEECKGQAEGNAGGHEEETEEEGYCEEERTLQEGIGCR